MNNTEMATLGRELADMDLGLSTAEEAVEVIKALTGTTELAELIPEVWASEIERDAQANRVMRNLDQVIKNTDLLDSPGDIVHIPKLHDLTPAAALTETVAVVPQAMSDDVVDFTPTEWGTGVELTRKMLRRAYVPVMEDAVEVLGIALAQGEDVEIITQAIAGVSIEVFPVSTYTTVDDILVGDVMTPDIMVDARTQLRLNDAPGPYAWVIHPAQEGALLKDDQFVDASKYGNNQIVLNGEIGTYLGMRIFVSTNIPSAVNVGTITYYKSLILGQRSLGLALKANPDMQEKYEPTDRTHTLVSVMEFDTGALNDDRYAVVYTA